MHGGCRLGRVGGAGRGPGGGDGRGRTYRVVLARQVAMYLLHVGCGLSLGRVSAAFGRDRATISYAVKALELKRDEPAFDAWLQALEDSVVRAPVMS